MLPEAIYIISSIFLSVHLKMFPRNCTIPELTIIEMTHVLSSRVLMNILKFNDVGKIMFYKIVIKSCRKTSVVIIICKSETLKLDSLYYMICWNILLEVLPRDFYIIRANFVTYFMIRTFIKYQIFIIKFST